MLIAAIFKSTQYTMAFPSSTLAWKQGHASPKARLAPSQSREMKSPSATSSSLPRPPRKSLTLQKAEKVWLKYKNV